MERHEEQRATGTTAHTKTHFQKGYNPKEACTHFNVLRFPATQKLANILNAYKMRHQYISEITIYAM